MEFMMPSLEDARQRSPYLEKFGMSEAESLWNAARVAANRGAVDQLQEVMDQAIMENKPVDWSAFVSRFHPRIT